MANRLAGAHDEPSPDPARHHSGLGEQQPPCDGARSYVSVYELSDPHALESAEFGARRGWGPFVNQVKFKTLRYALIAQIERP